MVELDWICDVGEGSWVHVLVWVGLGLQNFGRVKFEGFSSYSERKSSTLNIFWNISKLFLLINIWIYNMYE